MASAARLIQVMPDARNRSRPVRRSKSCAVQEKDDGQPKPDTLIVTKGNVCCRIDSDNHLIRSRPWVGDCISFAYDPMMSRSVFPNKLGSDLQMYCQLLAHELTPIHGMCVLELGTGSESGAFYLSSDNRHTGADIGPGSLKQAVNRVATAGSPSSELLCGACR